MVFLLRSCSTKSNTDSRYTGSRKSDRTELSDYAKKMLDYGRYDEVEAEYMTLIKRNGGKLCQ